MSFVLSNVKPKDGDMRSSNVLQSLDIQPINIAPKHFCWKQVIQVEQTVALRDNTRVTEWGSRHKGEGKDALTFISSSIRVFGILSLQIAVHTLDFQFWNWWPDYVTPLIKTHKWEWQAPWTTFKKLSAHQKISCWIVLTFFRQHVKHSREW